MTMFVFSLLSRARPWSPLRAAACRSGRAGVLVAAGAVLAAGTPVFGQDPVGERTEAVEWVNPRDGTFLDGGLALPSGPGPHRGVVLLSVAWTDPLVERLVSEGYAVLTPTLRGFVSVEPLLQATFADLANDLASAVGYLGSRAEVDPAAIAVVAQADNAPFAIDFLAETERTIPLVLLAPPVFSGVETFLLEQVGLAEGQGYGADDLRALEGYIREIADVVLGDGNPYMREYRLESLRSRSPVELPLNAAFPADERQMYFFASPLWHDRLAYQPEEALGPVEAPMLVLIGTDDPNTPMEPYLAALDRGLAASVTSDATVCRVPGRTRHVFSGVTVSVISEWLSARIEAPAGPARPAGAARDAVPAGCLADQEP